MLPRVEPVTAPGGGGAGAGEHGGAGLDAGVLGRRLDASLAELEIDGLRPYREGTSASRIHWPTVARRGEMLERRLVAELDSAPLIVLDPSAPGQRGGARQGGARRRVAVRPPRPRSAAARSSCRATGARSRSAMTWPAGPAVHARLALVESGSAPPSSALGPRGGAVIWVTGAGLASAPRALERLPAGARIVVSPERPARHPPAVRGRRVHRLPGRARTAHGGGVSGLAARPATAGAPAADAAAASAPAPPAANTRAHDRAVRLAAFAALALFAAAHWVDPGRVAAGRAHAAGRAGGHRHGCRAGAPRRAGRTRAGDGGARRPRAARRRLIAAAAC